MQRLSSPLDVQIELTEKCVQKCRHCYNYWRHSNSYAHQELGVSGFESIIDQLEKARVGLVTFTGGEPMLRKEILFRLIARAHAFGLETGLNSTAALISAEDAHLMSRNGLDHALISLLGPESIHNEIAGPGGSFKDTLIGIRNLLDAKIPVSVNMAVSKLNIDVIFETARLAKGIGVNSFCAGPIVPSCCANVPICLSPQECKRCLTDLIKVGSELTMNIDVLEPIARCLFSKKDEQDFVRFFANRTCSAAVSSCAISSTGNMRPCIHSDMIYGNVLPDKFIEIWDKMKDWALPSILPPKCRSCAAVVVCEGGCRMSARVTSGCYDGQDMYMTEPIMDSERVAILPSAEPTRLEIEDLLEFNRRCLLRKESEDRFVLYVGGRMEYITAKGFEFILLIKQHGEFTARSLAEKTESSEKSIVLILKRLIRSGVILRKEVLSVMC